MRLCLGKETRYVVGVVLAIRIDLQDMAGTRLCGMTHARDHRRALAAVPREAQQRHPIGMLCRQRAQHVRT